MAVHGDKESTFDVVVLGTTGKASATTIDHAAKAIGSSSPEDAVRDAVSSCCFSFVFSCLGGGGAVYGMLVWSLFILSIFSSTRKIIVTEIRFFLEMVACV